MRVLGIDPGLNRTGWGSVEQQGTLVRYIGCGVITAPAKLALAERLFKLHEGVAQVITLHTPQEAAIEETFVNVNAASTLKLGNARGALLLSLAIARLPVHEYAATKIKKSIVGAGRAEKGQVTMMVQTLLPAAPKDLPADAADALAIALCHLHHRQLPGL